MEKVWVGTRDARMHARLGLHAASESGRGIPKLLVCDKPGDEDLSRLVCGQALEVVVLVFLRLVNGRVVGNERRSLNVQERGGDKDKVACDIKVELPHPLDLGKVLIRHLRDGYRSDVHALPAHKLKE